MIRILVADDHNLVRAGVRCLLQTIPDFEVVGEADNGLQAVELARSLQPDVIVMDLGMPLLNGHEATARVREHSPGCEVIILSMHSEKLYVQRALELGARGYLLKSSLAEELPVAIRSVIQRNVYLSPGIACLVLDDYLYIRRQLSSANPVDLLTVRERQVLQLTAEGHSNREIASIMQVGERTVEKHRANLMEKLDIHDTPSLVRMAIKYGVITIDH